MNQITTASEYAVLSGGNTLVFNRDLPAKINTVWSWLTDATLRRQWLADGEMELAKGAKFELVWRNEQLSEPADQIGGPSNGEHSMQSVITEIDPGRLVSFTWTNTDGVTITLENGAAGTELKLVHKALPDHNTLLNIAAGWHAHLGILASRLSGEKPTPFWDAWRQLKSDYEQRIAA